MKKIFLSLAFMLTCLAGFSQSANDIITQLKSEQGVEAQVLTKMMLQMQFAQSPDEKVKELGKKMNGMSIMSMTKATDEVKAKFEEMVGKLTENGYEKAEETEQMGMKSVSYIMKDGDNITELVNVIDAQGEKVFILITGKFTQADLEALNNM